MLESIVKNCGAPVHEEVFTKENCEMFSSFLEQTPHENVRQKMLELVQTWAYAFRSSDKYQAIKVSFRLGKLEIAATFSVEGFLIKLGTCIIGEKGKLDMSVSVVP